VQAVRLTLRMPFGAWIALSAGCAGESASKADAGDDAGSYANSDADTDSAEDDGRGGIRANFDSDFSVGPPPAILSDGTEISQVYRLREGIERFFITDINNPAATTIAQSELAVMYDQVTTEIQWFNHIPGGANVLYMDGHVEFIRYPDDWPVSPNYARLIEEVGWSM